MPLNNTDLIFPLLSLLSRCHAMVLLHGHAIQTIRATTSDKTLLTTYPRITFIARVVEFKLNDVRSALGAREPGCFVLESLVVIALQHLLKTLICFLVLFLANVPPPLIIPICGILTRIILYVVGVGGA